MQHERSAPDPALQDPDHPARSVLGILTDHHPAIVAVDELVREYAGASIERQRAEVSVADGLAQLMQAGLAHRLEGFVFASQAAVHAEKLRL